MSSPSPSAKWLGDEAVPLFLAHITSALEGVAVFLVRIMKLLVALLVVEPGWLTH